MKSKIYDMMYPLIHDGSGIYELDDLDAYVDKIIAKGNIISIIEQDVLVGFLAYYANDYENKLAFLSMTIVLPSTRRMGYGRRLLDFFLAELLHKGFKRCLTEIKAENIVPITICKRAGFHELERKGKYIVLEKFI
ncbi:GNAT family N-acetyltransferase [Mucilaginibacter sp.]|uniref:GNAT family N-acetyltransferase n=1 Tax=Mucilaginibacter sp. TaxID=1882438 RepID=UPI00260D052E|nr:GNAT family N-acetyltransferase [Mucilaginibacter sp.]MDB4922236.1 Acetyltransferase family protein [Mucilaginibacter sp.]